MHENGSLLTSVLDNTAKTWQTERTRWPKHHKQMYLLFKYYGKIDTEPIKTVKDKSIGHDKSPLL